MGRNWSTTIRLQQTRTNAFLAQKSPIFIYLNAKFSGQNPDCPSQVRTGGKYNRKKRLINYLMNFNVVELHRN